MSVVIPAVEIYYSALESAGFPVRRARDEEFVPGYLPRRHGFRVSSREDPVAYVVAEFERIRAEQNIAEDVAIGPLTFAGEGTEVALVRA